MTQKEHIIREYEGQEVVDTFDSERSLYAYQRFKHKKESQVLHNAIMSREDQDLKVLDIACGTGRMIDTCLNNWKSVSYTGADSSQTMLDSIKRDDVKLVKVDAESLPFEDNTFDVVFTFHLLWHLPNEVQLKIIKEMKRVCKKGGVVLIDIINEDFKLGRHTEGIYKWKQIGKIKRAKLNKLNDFPFKSSLVYYLFNIMNYFERWLPVNLFHMAYFTIEK